MYEDKHTKSKCGLGIVLLLTEIQCQRTVFVSYFIDSTYNIVTTICLWWVLKIFDIITTDQIQVLSLILVYFFGYRWTSIDKHIYRNC